MLPRLDLSRRAWRWGLLLVLAVNLLGLHFALRPEPMWAGLENHDTRIMLKHIRLEPNPIRWLWSDWPLNNGFYRPLPAYAFMADVALWGTDLAKYKILSWLVATAVAFALAWFLLELTRSRAYAVAGAALFSLWQTDLLLPLPLREAAILASFGIVVFGLRWRPGRWREWVPLAGAVVMLSLELPSPPMQWDLSGRSFGYRNMGWPPGRTATMFTLASLLCLAAYLRWDRDPRGRWVSGSFLALVAAAMCYEQVVVLPALLIATALWRTLESRPPLPRGEGRGEGSRLETRNNEANELPRCALPLKEGEGRGRGFTSQRPKTKGGNPIQRWLPVGIAIAFVAGYWAWHSAAIPMTTDYQAQHGRTLSSGLFALAQWAYPEAGSVRFLVDTVDPSIGFWMLVFPSTWFALWMATANAFAFRAAATYARALAFGLGASLVAFSPMAFQKPLGHYYYLPATFRTVYVIVLAVAAWRLAKGLWETPARGAAPIPDEAPTPEPELAGIRV